MHFDIALPGRAQLLILREHKIRPLLSPIPLCPTSYQPSQRAEAYLYHTLAERTQ
jgi:hypothetical protein